MVTIIGKCLESISDCLYGTGHWRDPQPLQPHAVPLPEVLLDTSSMGQEAVVVKNGTRLCGTGCARATTPILQNKAYWEIKLQQSGVWSCGVSSPNCDMSKNLGLDNSSWALNSSQCILINGVTQYKIEQQIQEGDILGLTYDHVELNFYLNGCNLNTPILGIKGTVYPIFYVDDGAILDVIFDQFRSPPPSGFDRIMVEKALL